MTEEGECGVDGDCYDNEIPRLRFASLGMTYGWRGVPACARTTGGDGFPASSWGWALCGNDGYGDGSPHGEDNGWGWILACVFAGGLCAGGTGMGPRMREDNGRGWILPASSWGWALCAGGTGMGPRMREDNGWGWILACVFTGVGPVRGVRGWVPACARTREGMDSSLRLHGGGTLCGGVRGWVPACARTTGGDGNEEGAATR